MFSFRSIATAGGREILERFMHQHIFELLREEMARGGSDATIVGNFLKKLRSNAVLEKVREVLGPEAAGLAVTGLGAAIAEFLQDQVWTRHIPGNSQVMNEVRVLLQNIVPALIVGTSEAGGDLLENYDAHVDNVIARFRSNPDIPVAQPAGLLDKVFMVRPESLSQMKHPHRYAGQMFIPKLKADGTPEMIGEPDCQYPHLICELGRQFTLEWFAEQSGKTIEEKVTTPGQQNQQGNNGQQQNNRQTTTTRTVPAKPVPFKGDLVLLEDWARYLAQGVHSTDRVQVNRILQALERNKPKPAAPAKDQQELVDAQGDTFQTAAAKSLHQLDDLHRKVVVDFLQDVTKAIYINKLGRQFTPDANGMYSKDEMEAIVAYIEMWMGGKLSFWNKARLFLNHLGGEVRAANSGAARALRFLAGFGKWGSIASLAVMITAAIMFLVGALFMDAPSVANPSLMPMYFVIFGAGIMIIALFLITPIQTAVDVFWPSLKAENPQWLKDKGRLLITFIGLMTALFMIFLFVGAEQILRVMISVPAFIAIAVSMGLVAVGEAEEARLRTRNTLRHFPTISITCLGIVFTLAILNQLNVSAAKLIGKIVASKICMSLLIFLVALYVVAKIIRKLEITKWSRKHGVLKNYTWRPNYLYRFIGAVLVLLLAAWPWVGKELSNKFGNDNAIHAIIDLGKRIFASTPAPAGPPAGPPASGAIRPAPAVTSRAPVAHSRSKRHAKSSTDSAGEIDCNNVTPDFKEAAGCN